MTTYIVPVLVSEQTSKSATKDLFLTECTQTSLINKQTKNVRLILDLQMFHAKFWFSAGNKVRTWKNERELQCNMSAAGQHNKASHRRCKCASSFLLSWMKFYSRLLLYLPPHGWAHGRINESGQSRNMTISGWAINWILKIFIHVFDNPFYHEIKEL